MEDVFYIIISAILLFTIPLAERSIVFAPIEKNKGYSPLRGMSLSGRRVAWCGAFLIIFILFLICVNKSEDLPDVRMYRLMYDMGGGDKINRDIEPTFAILTKISPTFIVLLGIYGMLSVSGHIISIFKNSPIIWLSLGIYLTYTFILHDMIQMRAGVAFGLLLIAVRYIKERNWIMYYVFVAIAFYFHYSVLPFFVFYFIPTKHINKWVWSSLLIVATIGGFLNVQFGYVAKFIPVDIVQHYLENYMGSKTYDPTPMGGLRVLKVVCIIIMLFYQKQIVKKYPLFIPVIVFYIFSQMSFMLLSDIPVLQGRFGEMFAAFEIFALSSFPLISKKHYYVLMIVPIVLAILQAREGYSLLTTISVI